MVADEGEPAYSKWLVLLSFVAIFLITAVTATSLFAETQALARWGLRTFGSMLITWGVSQACAFFYDTDASNAELLQRIFLVSECALAIPSSSCILYTATPVRGDWPYRSHSIGPRCAWRDR